jgi:hypothetical protein
MPKLSPLWDPDPLPSNLFRASNLDLIISIYAGDGRLKTQMIKVCIPFGYMLWKRRKDIRCCQNPQQDPEVLKRIKEREARRASTQPRFDVPLGY